MPFGTVRMLYESGRHSRLLEQIEEAGKLLTDPVDQFYHERYRYQYLMRIGRPREVLRWVDAEAAKLVGGGGAAEGNLQLTRIARWTVLDLRAKALAAIDSLAASRAAAAALMVAADEFGNYERVQALLMNARIALAEEDREVALELLDQLEREPTGVGAERIDGLEIRAALYSLVGELEKAVSVHEELLSGFGGHAVSHYELGLLYEKMDRPADAASEYRRFLEMWANADEGLPQLVDARERLSALAGKTP
jgi:tetratricopeptide (TPR) repeat protein